jgi:exosortase
MTVTPSIVRPVSNRPPAGILSVLAASLVLIAGLCVLLLPQWRENPDLSHGFFAPLVFFLLISECRRQGTQRWLPASTWSVAGQAVTLFTGLVLFALAGLFAASLAWNHALVLLLLASSACVFLLAALVILADERVRLVPFNWISFTAILLWVLVTPLPNGTYTRLTFGLQGLVTDSVMHTLHLLGIPAKQHGNVIELATTSVGVEEACSGIRSLLSCIYAGLFFAAWQLRHPAARVTLVLAAPVLALGMNFLRSLALTLLANAGKDISGFWHDATGFAILGVTAALLAGLAILLESKAPVGSTSPPPALARTPRISLQLYWAGIAATLLLGIFYFANSRPSRREGVPVPNLAGLLPAQPEGWQVVTPTDLYQFADILQTTHLMERTYLRSAGNGQFTQFTVYVAYWKPGQAAVSRVASHTPDACWPGSGWAAQPSVNPQQILQLPGLKTSPGEHRIFRNAEGFPQNVWFWHIYDGKPINYRDPYSVSALFQIALEYGFRRQGDQFFVRVSSNKNWDEIAQEPLVREIFANLASIGL